MSGTQATATAPLRDHELLCHLLAGDFSDSMFDSLLASDRFTDIIDVFKDISIEIGKNEDQELPQTMNLGNFFGKLTMHCTEDGIPQLVYVVEDYYRNKTTQVRRTVEPHTSIDEPVSNDSVVPAPEVTEEKTRDGICEKLVRVHRDLNRNFAKLNDAINAENAAQEKLKEANRLLLEAAEVADYASIKRSRQNELVLSIRAAEDDLIEQLAALDSKNSSQTPHNPDDHEQ